MRSFIIRGGLFIAIPLLVVELSLRVFTATGPMKGVDRLYNVYNHLAPRLASPDTVNCLFVGTSRIQAAIVPDRFSQAVHDHSNVPVKTLRASRGYSTLLMHYEGIKYLIDRRPEAMKGSYVFVEAASGLVEPQTWTSRWARPEWPTLLSSHLSLNELWSLWWSGEDRLKIKALITASQFLETARYGALVREKLRQKIASLLSPAPQSQAEEDNAQIQKGAGIRTDSAGIALARKKIIPSMKKWAHVDYERPPVDSPVDWSKSMLASVVETMRRHGGEVILYTMPLSSPAQSVIEESVQLRRERRRLKEWAKANSVPFLKVDFSHTDEDFPDLAHLRKSAAPEYTQKVATTYVERGFLRTPTAQRDSFKASSSFHSGE
jgi:hypothetical protein